MRRYDQQCANANKPLTLPRSTQAENVIWTRNQSSELDFNPPYRKQSHPLSFKMPMAKRMASIRARVRRVREQGAIRERLEPNMALYDTDRPHRSPSARAHLTHHSNRITKTAPKLS